MFTLIYYSKNLNRTELIMEEFKKWECIVCGWIYDEAEGLPEEGIPPGTKWEDVPHDWVCPDCGVGKEDFDMMPLEGSGKSS